MEMKGMEPLEPKNLQEAMKRADWVYWKGGMDEEYTVLKEANMWELMDLPPGANLVSCRWIFRAKKGALGTVVHYKAHLVAQGFF